MFSRRGLKVGLQLAALEVGPPQAVVWRACCLAYLVPFFCTSADGLNLYCLIVIMYRRLPPQVWVTTWMARKLSRRPGLPSSSCGGKSSSSTEGSSRSSNRQRQQARIARRSAT